MERIPERIYRNGVIKIFENTGWNLQKINRSIFFAEKQGRKIIFRNCGKKLPYPDGFPWETWIRCKYLDELDNLSIEYSATEIYIVYSYAILDENFKEYFNQTEEVQDWIIGCKVISTKEFIDNSQERRGWEEEGEKKIDLPRKKLPDILHDVTSI